MEAKEELDQPYEEAFPFADQVKNTTTKGLNLVTWFCLLSQVFYGPLGGSR